MMCQVLSLRPYVSVRVGLLTILAVSLCLTVGCGGRSGPKVVKVSGTVLVDGKPLQLPGGVQAFVQFVPAGVALPPERLILRLGGSP